MRSYLLGGGHGANPDRLAEIEKLVEAAREAYEGPDSPAHEDLVGVVKLGLAQRRGCRLRRRHLGEDRAVLSGEEGGWSTRGATNTVQGLLSAGTGRCGAWTHFFRETLDAVGFRDCTAIGNRPSLIVEGAEDDDLETDDREHSIFFFAKNWTFSAGTQAPYDDSSEAQLLASFAWHWSRVGSVSGLGGNTVAPASGMAVHGSADPISHCVNHSVCERGGMVHDPSSGRASFQSDYLAGFVYTHTDEAGTEVFVVRKYDTALPLRWGP